MRSLSERTTTRAGSSYEWGGCDGKRDAPYIFLTTSHRAPSGVGAHLKIWRFVLRPSNIVLRPSTFELPIRASTFVRRTSGIWPTRDDGPFSPRVCRIVL